MDAATRWLLRHRRPRWRLMAAYALPLVGGVLVFGWGLLNAPLRMSLFERWLGVVLAGVVLLSWPTAAFMAALPASTDRLAVLRLTTLSEEALVQSLIFRAVWRVRVVLAAALGGVPPLALAWAKWKTLTHCDQMCEPLHLWQIGVAVLLSLPLTVFVGGAALTFAAHGVAMGLRLRVALFATVASLMAGSVAMLPALIVIGIVQSATLQMVTLRPQPVLIGAAAFVNLCVAVIPIAIGRTVLTGVRMRGLPAEDDRGWQ